MERDSPRGGDATRSLEPPWLREAGAPVEGWTPLVGGVQKTVSESLDC